MRHLDRVKKWGNIAEHVLLLEEAGVSDANIMKWLEVSKQTIYNTRQLYAPLSGAIADINVDTLPTTRTKSEGVEVTDKRNEDVQFVVDTFKDCFGTTNVSKYDRYAANRLAKKYGALKVQQIIAILASHQGEPYVPVVNSVRELDAKLVAVQAYFKRLEKQSPIEL